MKIKSYLHFSWMLISLSITFLIGGGCRSSASDPTLTSIAITPGTASLMLSSTQAFTATGSYSDSSTSDLTTTVTWNSSDSAVASLNSAGLASTLSAGSTTITASLNSVVSNAASLEVNQAYAYIANYGNNTVSICAVNADTSLEDCSVNNDPSFNGPTAVAVNSADSLAYVVNYDGNSLSQCPLNNDGSFGACVSIPGISSPTGLALNPSGTILYVSTLGINPLLICALSDNGSVSSCTNSGLSIPAAQGVAVSESFAYISDLSTDLYICPIQADGSLGSCTISTGNGTFNTMLGVALNADYSSLYTANYADGVDYSVSSCPLNGNTVGTCIANEGNSTFDFSAYTVSGLSSGTNSSVYIPNCGNNTVSVCPLASNGSFGTCSVNNDSSFNVPSALALGVAP